MQFPPRCPQRSPITHGHLWLDKLEVGDAHNSFYSVYGGNRKKRRELGVYVGIANLEYLIHSLLVWEAETHTWRNRQGTLSPAGQLLNCIGQGWVRAESRSWELNPGLTGRDSPTWAVTCCPPGFMLAGNWSQKLNPGTLMWDTDLLTARLNTCSTQFNFIREKYVIFSLTVFEIKIKVHTFM